MNPYLGIESSQSLIFECSPYISFFFSAALKLKLNPHRYLQVSREKHSAVRDLGVAQKSWEMALNRKISSKAQKFQ
jgi:hypothetical protein